MNQVISKRALLKQYVDQIEQLNAELAASREQNGVYLDPAQYEAMKADLESLTKEKEARLLEDEKLEEQMRQLRSSLQEVEEKLEEKTAALVETTQELKTTQFMRKEGYEVSVTYNETRLTRLRLI